MRGTIGFDLAVGLGLRGLGAVSSFALLWLIAQTNGPEVVSAYQLGLTSAALLAVICLAGLDILIVRGAATIVRDGTLGDLKSTFNAGRRLILRSGSTGAIVMLLGGAAATAFIPSLQQWAGLVLAYSPAVLLLGLLRHSNALLRSQGNVLLSQSLEGVSFTSLTAAVIAGLWLSGLGVNPIVLPIVYLIGLSMAVFISFAAARKISDDWGEGTPQIDIPTGLRVTGAPILMMSGEWLTLLALVALAGLADAGIYRTAFMICSLFQLVNASFDMMAGPHLARANAANDRAGVMAITLKVGLIGFVIVSPLAALCFFVPEFLLGLFGEEFLAGVLTLQLLAAAQMINVIFGPVGTALIMVGRERQVLMIEIVGTLLTITLALALIPGLGMIGAAIGVASATVFRNTVSRIALNLWRPVAA